ncbi:MAG TPA: helix-turn-helix domain-containing protein [Desulfomonilaceae bacterium]|nr:helix-turn-helix domain-containing protein [Desulfomonilaceae bacterium]
MAESESLKEVQKEHILRVLRSTQGDIDQACQILGISTGSLRRKVKELRISIKASEAKESDIQQKT